MFCAAFLSRSCRTPQAGQTHSLTSSVRASSRYPQAEQVLEDGYQRSILTSVRPYHRALYSNWRTKPPHPTSLMAFASEWFLTMPLLLRVSRQITWFSRISLVDTCCWKSRRVLGSA